MRGAVRGSRAGPGVVRGRLGRAGSCLPGLCRPACRPVAVARPGLVPVCAPACCGCASGALCRCACRGLCRLVCRLARARLVGRSAWRPVPACACLAVRSGSAEGLTCCRSVPACVPGLHARLVGRLLAASGCRCGGPVVGRPGGRLARRLVRGLVAVFVSACGPVCGGRAGLVGRVRAAVCVPCLCAVSVCLVVRVVAGPPPRGVGFRGGLCAGFRVGR